MAGSVPQSHLHFYGQFINLQIDCPLSYHQSEEMPHTYLAMTVRDINDPTKVIGIVQLMMRMSTIRFTEQDVNHLGLIC